MQLLVWILLYAVSSSPSWWTCNDELWLWHWRELRCDRHEALLSGSQRFPPQVPVVSKQNAAVQPRQLLHSGPAPGEIHPAAACGVEQRWDVPLRSVRQLWQHDCHSEQKAVHRQGRYSESVCPSTPAAWWKKPQLWFFWFCPLPSACSDEPRPPAGSSSCVWKFYLPGPPGLFLLLGWCADQWVSVLFVLGIATQPAPNYCNNSVCIFLVVREKINFFNQMSK